MSTQITTDDVRAGDIISLSLKTALSDPGASVIVINDAKVMGILSAGALRNPAQAAANHVEQKLFFSESQQMYADAYTSYTYLSLDLDPLLETGKRYVEVGLPWIAPSTIYRSSGTVRTVLLFNWNPSNDAKLSAVLKAHGFSDFHMQ